MGEKFEGRCPRCKGTGKLEERACGHCKGTGKMKIEMASTEGIGYLQEYVDRIMDAVDEVTGVEGAWISDESQIGDFPVEDGDCKRLSEILGIEVKKNDFILDLAKKLRNL